MVQAAYSYAKLDKGILNIRFLRRKSEDFRSVAGVSENIDELFLEKQNKTSSKTSNEKKMMQKQQKENSL